MVIYVKYGNNNNNKSLHNKSPTSVSDKECEGINKQIDQNIKHTRNANIENAGNAHGTINILKTPDKRNPG